MTYAKFVLLLIVATFVPLTPGTEDVRKGVVSCQHSNSEALFFVTRAVAVRYVVFVFACAKMEPARKGITERVVGRIMERVGERMKNRDLICERKCHRVCWCTCTFCQCCRDEPSSPLLRIKRSTAAHVDLPMTGLSPIRMSVCMLMHVSNEELGLNIKWLAEQSKDCVQGAFILTTIT
jgi:hypothetical protein